MSVLALPEIIACRAVLLSIHRFAHPRTDFMEAIMVAPGMADIISNSAMPTKAVLLLMLLMFLYFALETIQGCDNGLYNLCYCDAT